MPVGCQLLFRLMKNAMLYRAARAESGREAPERCPIGNQRREGGSVTKVDSLQIRHRTITLQPTERTSKKVCLTLSLAAVQAGRPPSLDDLAKTPEWKGEDSYFDPRFPEKNYQ